MSTGDYLPILSFIVPLILAALAALIKIRMDANATSARVLALELRDTAREREIMDLNQKLNMILVTLGRLEERLNSLIDRRGEK